MKIILLLNIFISISLLSIGQDLGDAWYYLTFEDTSGIAHIRIDSTLNQNNLWQIGSPQKNQFTDAISPVNAIVTDTLYPYPVNDTSRFEIVNVANGDGWLGYAAIFSGYYKVNTDTLTDYGKIELSLDNGVSWIDLTNDTTYSGNYTWDSQSPVLSGNSNGWQHFGVNLAGLGPIFNIQRDDTIRYRFTFISDSIQTNKDGIMFDDFHFEDWAEGVPEIRNDNLISIFPNPASNFLTVTNERSTIISKVKIFNFEGKLILDIPNFVKNNIDITELANGIYILKYTGKDFYSIKQFVVEH